MDRGFGFAGKEVIYIYMQTTCNITSYVDNATNRLQSSDDARFNTKRVN